MKNETLEEAAKNFSIEKHNHNFDNYFNQKENDSIDDFTAGANWQQERSVAEAKKIIDFLDTEHDLNISDKETINRIKWYFKTYFEPYKSL